MPPKRETVEKARKLRRALSPPEVALWQWLRSRPDGFKFRRQHLAGPYILDFYCPSARLAIEVDGGGHDIAEQIARDARRDGWLQAQGLRVLRVRAVDIFRDFDAVGRQILHCCCTLPSTSLRLVPLPMLRMGRIK
ncbi:Very-short-patch-repair endonuclease [Sphingobium sp. AP50]|uniref:endonuclease domain-containing protein n=1 Tax=Sphingobium sp. AP50 TaxID=1884369 RepID=UPI0008AB72FE|nr:Very-short-patch-repair endonuclease [Sphingobium sp. AP50]